jgi:hypothetical protein
MNQSCFRFGKLFLHLFQLTLIIRRFDRTYRKNGAKFVALLERDIIQMANRVRSLQTVKVVWFRDSRCERPFGRLLLWFFSMKKKKVGISFVGSPDHRKRNIWGFIMPLFHTSRIWWRSTFCSLNYPGYLLAAPSNSYTWMDTPSASKKGRKKKKKLTKKQKPKWNEKLNRPVHLSLSVSSPNNISIPKPYSTNSLSMVLNYYS